MESNISLISAGSWTGTDIGCEFCKLSDPRAACNVSTRNWSICQTFSYSVTQCMSMRIKRYIRKYSLINYCKIKYQSTVVSTGALDGSRDEDSPFNRQIPFLGC